MTTHGWLQLALFSLLVLGLTRPVGLFLFRVFEGDRQPLPRTLGRVERLLCRLCGVDARQEQTWVQYLLSLLLFSVLGLLVTFALQRLQHHLPLNPQRLGAVPVDLAFNTALLFLVGATATSWAESQSNPALRGLAIDQSAGNLEGKELRFGVAGSALYATVTTDASCGAVNAMHDSFTPLGGLVLLVNIQLGEVIFGGVGAGLYGMLIFALLAVFIAGLMVGRTPEYLGKKIDAREIKLAMLFAPTSAAVG